MLGFVSWIVRFSSKQVVQLCTQEKRRGEAREMESSSSLLSSCLKENLDLIQQAILQLMEEEEENKRKSLGFVAVNEDDDEEEDCRHLVLTRLLSQLDAVRANEKIKQPKSSFDAKDISYAVTEVEPTGKNLNKVEVGNCGIGNEEIAQELRKVKRQNFITHCLLTVMIILTVGWQLSEVSLILMVKNGMSHPFRSLGWIVKWMLKGPKMNVQDGEKMASTKEKLIAASSLPGLKIPELPRMELPAFDLSNDED